MMSLKKCFHSSRAEETIALGEEIGKHLCDGDVLGLVGELGAGKTTLIKGIARGLKISDGTDIKSPTFIIHNRHTGKNRILNHLDFYRLKSDEELESIGFRDIITADSVTVIEWVDRIPPVAEQCSIMIFLEFEGNGRKITVR
jgi:tRNA threonylcarbamoyladenosine biosynthesis protein TsaE